MSPPGTRQRPARTTGPAATIHKPGRTDKRSVTVEEFAVVYRNADGQVSRRRFRTLRAADKFVDRRSEAGPFDARVYRRLVGGPGRPVWREVR